MWIAIGLIGVSWAIVTPICIYEYCRYRSKQIPASDQAYRYLRNQNYFGSKLKQIVEFAGIQNDGSKSFQQEIDEAFKKLGVE